MSTRWGSTVTAGRATAATASCMRSGRTRGRTRSRRECSMRTRSVLALALLLVGCGATHPAAVKRPAAAHHVRSLRRATPVHVVERSVGSLASAVQDAAAVGGPPLLVGGLTPADVSTSAVEAIRATHEVRAGSLPAALHDAAAARLGGSGLVLRRR